MMLVSKLCLVCRPIDWIKAYAYHLKADTVTVYISSIPVVIRQQSDTVSRNSNIALFVDEYNSMTQ